MIFLPDAPPAPDYAAQCLPLLVFLRDRPTGKDRPRIPAELTPMLRAARDGGLVDWSGQWVLSEAGRAATEEAGA